MDSILAKLPRQTNANVLIGFESADDAGVYQLTKDLALVQTVDFFTPIVDDPFTFGQIAAANALSDVYAMAGRPISSLAVVGFPRNGLPYEILEYILLGGLEKMREAECTVIGGHSISDDEIKFGYAVTGLVNPERVLSNKGAQAGDRLVLTKKLGTGVIATALKRQKASKEAVSEAVNSMQQLNRKASEAVLESQAHALTDITGFGLLGHGREMALASGVSLRFDHKKIALLPAAREYSRQGHLAGGLKNNRDFLAGCVEISSKVPEEIQNLLFDPQTSGGLLISLEAAKAAPLASQLEASSIHAQVVGEVTPKVGPLLSVL